MEDAAHTSFPLVDIAFVIVIAVLMGLGLTRLKQPPLVGFILAGVIMGPTGFGFIAASDNVTSLAEMGVLVLLFFIGTEISLKAFVISLRPAVIVAGGQLLVSLVIGYALSWLTSATVAEGVVLGFIIALSSTVVAMKMLDDMDELRGDAGKITIGVLIAQDIAVVPMLILITALSGEEADPRATAFKIAAAVAVLGVLLWWLGRRGKLHLPFTRHMDNKVELLALGSLAACFGAAAVAGAAGLSPAYGAFMAGLVIGNSTMRNKVIPVIEPIQSILLVVFFLSIGLLIDLHYIGSHLGTVLGAVVLVTAAKTLLNIFLLRATGHDQDTALIAGLSMAQIGEFSFVLAAAAFTGGVMGFDFYRLAITVTAITLLLSPAWMSVMHRIENIANDGYSSYREALAEAYANEIENVGEGLWWLKVRRRAFRKAAARRKARRTERLASAAGSGEETARPPGDAGGAGSTGEGKPE
ncbi:MAG: cation:proton antiporter [Notoacmeibacter sp.]|nr:cation:proton antiporter [Notoacmeibacter sp.]